MNWMDGIGSALDAAGDVAASLYDQVGQYATEAFDWLEENPAAANILGGAAVGVASYYENKVSDDALFTFKREMYGRARDDAMINPGTIENYGTHVGSAKKGLLTNGMIAGGR